MVHETSHKKGAILIDEVYGEAKCLDFAKKRPTKAKENGDSYAMFAERLKNGFVAQPK